MKKITKVAMLLMFILVTTVALVACDFSAADVEAIRFVNAPASSYALNADVPISSFRVEVTYGNGNTVTFALDNSALTVQGITADKKLDTATAGIHTIIVTYQAVKCEFTYNVTTTDPQPTTSDIRYETNDTPAKLFYDRLVAGGEVTIDSDIDLSAYEWNPVASTADSVTLTGTGRIIGLTISNWTAGNGVGLFANSTKNITVEGTGNGITFENTKIISQGTEVAVIVGRPGGSTFNVKNVTFKNTVLSGLSCVAAVTGRVHASEPAVDATIADVTVDGGTFSAYNPVTVSNGDGEGDKVAGIVGQLQRAPKAHSVTGCELKNLLILGTRDLGGIAAYIIGNTTISNNTVRASVMINASVSGGMLERKGTRNVGGLVGTIEGRYVSESKTLLTVCTFKDNVVETNSLYTSSSYDNSSANKFIGGVRPPSQATLSFTCTINDVTYTLDCVEPVAGTYQPSFTTTGTATMPDLSSFDVRYLFGNGVNYDYSALIRFQGIVMSFLNAQF